MSEEQAFWCLAQTIECILPIDYYTHLLGFVLDRHVLEIFLLMKIPVLARHFQQE